MSFPDLTAGTTQNVAYAVPVAATPVTRQGQPVPVAAISVNPSNGATNGATNWLPKSRSNTIHYYVHTLPAIPPIPAPVGRNPTATAQSYPYATAVPPVPTAFGYGGAGAGAGAGVAVGIGSTVGRNFDRSFFSNYDQVVADIQSLQYVDQAIQDTSKRIETSSFELQRVKHKIGKLRKSERKLQKRVQRNENPRFLHYLQLNRHEKVERLKGEYNALKSADEKLLGEEQALDRNLRQLKQQKNSHVKQKQRRSGLQQQRDQLFDQVVDSQPPTPLLRQVNNNIAVQSTEIQKETTLLHQIDEVVSRIRLAEQQYSKSLQLLQRAQRLNAGAAVTNFGRGRGMELIETSQQASRDRLINQSSVPAQQGAVEMDRAWSVFPEEARRRHPELCSQIGRAPLPKLKGAHFGGTLAVKFVAGDFGDAMNGAHAARKISQNAAVVTQCIQIVRNQQNLVVALRQGVLGNINTMKSQLGTMQSQRRQERETIFTTVRSRA